jgi:hypothetical protein
MTGPKTNGPRHIDHEALTIWKLLLKEGGYWRTREISAELRTEGRVDKVRHALDRLTLNGMLRSRQAPGKHPSFGVTPSCAAPPGYAWMLEVATHGVHPIDWSALEAEHA